MLLSVPRKRVQVACASVRGQSLPLRKRGPGGLDRRINVGGRSLGYGGQFLAGGRVGRVEVFAMGTPRQHSELRAILERGPRLSSVSEVQEELASPDSQYEGAFFINP